MLKLDWASIRHLTLLRLACLFSGSHTPASAHAKAIR